MPYSFIVAVHGCLPPDLSGGFFNMEYTVAKYKDLTNDELASMVQLYQNGWYSQRELAEIFKVSRATVRRALKEWPTPSPEVGEEKAQLGVYDWPSDPEWPTEDYVGAINNHKDWVYQAVAAVVCLALWVAIIIYFAIY